jgi:hypothetical protein
LIRGENIMADLSSFAQTVGNTGATIATLPDNFLKHVINQADVGRELFISVTKSGSGNVTNDVLIAVRAQLTLAGGDGTGSDSDGPDAFTIAAIGTADGSAFESGTTTVVFMRVQGTGTPNLTTVSGATLATVAVFQPAQ